MILDQSHRTAIGRNKPSAPARFLDERMLIKKRALDYGCGRGFDAGYYLMDRYDPHFFPERPDGKYNTILCTYVICVLPQEQRKKIIKDLRSLLEHNGKSYISVRRDLKKETNTQYIVELDLPIIESNRYFCIYELV